MFSQRSFKCRKAIKNVNKMNHGGMGEFKERYWKEHDKITGDVVVGAQPLNVFTAAINKALGKDAPAQKPAGKGAGGS